jgi:hypothetical protein
MYLIDIVLMDDNICSKFEVFIRDIVTNKSKRFNVFIGNVSNCCPVIVKGKDVNVVEYINDNLRRDETRNLVWISEGDNIYSFKTVDASRYIIND